MLNEEDLPVEYVLDAIGTIMSSQRQPKVILFDIGGVCVSALSTYHLAALLGDIP